MQYSLFVPALMAASAFAAPAVHYVTDVEKVTMTVTAGTPAATAYVQAPAPKVETKVEQVVKPKVITVPQAAPKPAAPAPVAAAPAPVAKPSTQVPSGDSSAPKSGGVSILDTFNKYRAEYGLPEMTWSQKLADNAYETGQGGNGVEQIHKLPALDGAGKCGQVITPGADSSKSGYGDKTPFEIAMLSWLCEKITPEIQDVCGAAMSANGMTYINTAHHDELVDPEYSQVGCAFFANPAATGNTPWDGLWTCSLES